ncbi:MAG: DNA-binding protein HU-beta, partial [Pseudomonadota bacterium]
MNKTELIDHIATKADISKAAAGRSLDAMIAAVKTT